MMEDDWVLPDVGGQPLQKCFEHHMEEAKKCAQQLSNGPKKTHITQHIFQKNCKELFTFVSAMVKRHAGKVYNASFHIFLMGLRYCKLALLHYCVQETSDVTGMFHAAKITPRMAKPSSKKQMAFKYVAYKSLQKKLALHCSKITLKKPCNLFGGMK